MKPSILLLFCLSLVSAFAPAAAGATKITQLFDFPCSSVKGTLVCPDGARPVKLLQASDGNFYGSAAVTDNVGSLAQGGTIFKITPAGQLTVLFRFAKDKNGIYSNGDGPAFLVDGKDGFLYGATTSGGTNNAGLVFRVGKSGGFKKVHAFCSDSNCSDGATPSGLILGRDGNLYGATEFGGSDNPACGLGSSGCGTLFRITPAGSNLTTLFAFQGSAADGRTPFGLIQGTDGNFYGSAIGPGTLTDTSEIFQATASGQLTVIHQFPYPVFPTGGVAQASNGKLFGLVGSQFLPDFPFFALDPSGQNFQMFASLQPTQGGLPPVLQTLASDGNLWGVDPLGGQNGTVFAFSSSGTVVTTIPFSGLNGSIPSSVIQAADGKLYGTTTDGGTDKNHRQPHGVVYVIDAGLPAN